MSAITISAPAKVNLHLEVLGRDTLGYHLLETVFQTLEWADQVTLRPCSGGISLACSDPNLPTDASNLAWQAAAAYLALRPGLDGVAIELTKRLPAGGGLGGGSSDAAAVLRGLAQLDPHPLPAEDMHALAASLGSDVPFFLVGGCAHASGRGEILTPLRDLQAQPVTVLIPPVHCSTPKVFQALTEDERGPRQARGASAWADALAADLPACLHNRLAAAALRAYPELTETMAWCAASGLPWLLSGSGACCLVIGEVTDPPPGVQAVSTRWRRRDQLDAVM